MCAFVLVGFGKESLVLAMFDVFNFFANKFTFRFAFLLVCFAFQEVVIKSKMLNVLNYYNT